MSWLGLNYQSLVSTRIGVGFARNLTALADSEVRGSGLTGVRLVLSVLFGLFLSTNSMITIIGFVFVAVIATAIVIVMSIIRIIKNMIITEISTMIMIIGVLFFVMIRRLFTMLLCF